MKWQQFYVALCLSCAVGCGDGGGAIDGMGNDLQGPEYDFAIDARGTYLRAVLDPGVRPPTVISLAEVGASGGDTLRLRRKGSFRTRFRRSDDGMAALFSASDIVVPNPGIFGPRDRVVDAIEAGDNVETPKSFFLWKPTDIQEDFEVTDSLEINVPQGATHLIVTAIDPYFSNNKSKGFSIGVTVINDGVDLCEGVVCEDDGSECTLEGCNSLNGLCETEPAPCGTPCDFNGLPGACGGGVCQDAMLCEGVSCDDDNECTVGVCDPFNGACDLTNVTDGTDCDFNELPGLCVGGLCQDALLCDNVDCDDDNECTIDACDAQNGQCASANVTDGTSCNLDGLPGICSGGLCQDAMLCESVNCDDGNSCTDDACDPLNGACDNTSVADGTACNFDGTPGICTGGLCQDAMLCQSVDCDDGNACTDDACDPLNGACSNTNVADGTSCNFNGLPGVCGGGLCQDAMLCQSVNCDDNNACTDDTCDPLSGACGNTAVADGVACNFNGLPGLCMAGNCEDAMLCTGVDCDDGNPCTDDACDPQNGSCGSTNVPDGTTCNFGGLPGLCMAGNCEDAMLCTGVDCDDGNPCTDDACDPQNGSCGSTNVADGTTCNFGGLPGLCMAGNCEDAMLCTGVDCDDGNPCTDDACDPQNGSCGSINVPDGTTCNGSGTCAGGTCVVPVDPDPQTGSQVLTCTVLGRTPTVPLSLTVDPDTEFTPGGSALVATVVTFTVPASIGDFLLGLGQDTVTLETATLNVAVNGATPSTISLFGDGLPLLIDVDADDDGAAEPLPFSTLVDSSVLTNDGSSSVDFEVSGFTLSLSGVPLLGTFSLSSDDSCTLDAPVPAITFPAN